MKCTTSIDHDCSFYQKNLQIELRNMGNLLQLFLFPLPSVAGTREREREKLRYLIALDVNSFWQWLLFIEKREPKAAYINLLALLKSLFYSVLSTVMLWMVKARKETVRLFSFLFIIFSFYFLWLERKGGYSPRPHFTRSLLQCLGTGTSAFMCIYENILSSSWKMEKSWNLRM